jgi:parallel beta-helix repeat protein
VLKNNTATGNQVGFSLGSHNTLANNTATNNLGNGFQLFADDHLLEANIAQNNGQNGVRLFTGASNNQIVKTKASGNGSFDLQDDNVNCGTNQWTNNTGTKSQGCIQ